ncbi:hypothetical protein JG687_00005832 [Phytophthora cactorum]|uniref:Uncharacterized protein n=1 Tax=Phytophthora cactorum TaxID=29920 RepID=A0A8T1UPA0_9STRA|nr:hypothetical protein JG687_00005832 [Phytophthora cactorum]
MPTWLYDEVRGRIRGFSEGGFSNYCQAITGAVKRALAAPRRNRRQPGRKPIVSDRLARLLLRKASSGDYTAAQLKIECNYKCSARTIRRLLSGVDGLVYTKMENTLALAAVHMAHLLALAKRMVVMPQTDWEQIIFFDEKKINLDGPDGLQSYGHDVRRSPRTTVRRQNGSVMVWAPLALMESLGWRCWWDGRLWFSIFIPYRSFCCPTLT